ncbi:LLM class flavin-dependent oxidoreductase [Rhodococcus sp. NPDC003994]
MSSTVSIGIDVGSGSVDPAEIRSVARAAENAGFTYVSFGDGDPTRGLDPVSRAAFVVGVTSTIGLVAPADTTYAEPFHVSSQLASLDHASRGRAGWIAVRNDAAAVASAWGRPHLTDDADLRREQRDAVTVARDLWDSWEDDAVIRHAASGRYLDRDRLHYVDFRGETYSVKGPAIVPRPPQGQVVVFGRAGELDDDLLDVVLVESQGDTGTATPTVLDVEAPTDRAGAEALADRIVRDRLSVRLRTDDPIAVLAVATRFLLPAVIAAGVVHRPRVGATLRDHLGLARPVNRFEAAS